MALRIVAAGLVLVMLAALPGMLQNWQWNVVEVKNLLLVVFGIAIGLACAWGGSELGRKVASPLVGRPRENTGDGISWTQWFILGLFGFAVLVALVCG